MNRRGFGVIDVMIGVVLLGILGAIASTSISSYTRSQEILNGRRGIEIEMNKIVGEVYDLDWNNLSIETDLNIETEIFESEYGTDVLILREREKEIEVRVEKFNK